MLSVETLLHESLAFPVLRLRGDGVQRDGGRVVVGRLGAKRVVAVLGGYVFFEEFVFVCLFVLQLLGVASCFGLERSI